MITLPHRARPAVGEHLAWFAAQVGLVGLLAAAVRLGVLGWLGGVGYGLVTGVLLGRALHRADTGVGPADRVTLARGTLVGGVTAIVVAQGSDTALLVGLAAVALVLDFVDGRVARRTGTASRHGARFDLEVDAFLILVLSVRVAVDLGPWVLAIGLMRYLYVAASWGLPWLRGDLPPSRARKVVAAVQGVVLVVAAARLLPHAEIPVGLALAALTWSFGRDVGWLHRHRTDRRGDHGSLGK